MRAKMSVEGGSVGRLATDEGAGVQQKEGTASGWRAIEQVVKGLD
jgi:hypothetical protein